MNSLYFSFKRAFQSSMRVTRFVLRRHDLTPARFDMLLAIGLRSERLQSHLHDILGVTAQTVSRMLRSLIALGFVARERCQADKRYWLVKVTREGLLRVQRAVAPSSYRLVETTFAFAVAVSSPSGRAGARQATRLSRVLFGIARAFADKANLEFKWPREHEWPPLVSTNPSAPHPS